MYKIMWKIPGEYPEEIDTAKDIKEANYLINEYNIAFHGQDRVYKKKAKRQSWKRQEYNI
jgi:hypothetical protein